MPISSSLNAEGRRLAKRYIEYLESQDRYTNVRPKIREIPVQTALDCVSAGIGEDFIADDEFEEVLYPESVVPDGTDFAIRIDGDSMEPAYHDGQVVFVEKCETLNDGEVGIMYNDGRGYMKVYREMMPVDEDVEECTDSYGNEYLAVFDKIIQSPHIDVYPSETKQTGAYESLSGNETTPFVMFNFDDTQTYISTIVHEMGHAVYSQFSAENQNEYNNQPGIFTQEVASTANEIMFHNYMIKNAGTTDEKLYWIDHEINLFLSTLARQCMYSEFEDYCYKTIEGGGSLDATAMANKWIELEKLYYGDVMTILDDSGIDWARVPHFYYNYYVYKYATSITYAAALCKQVETNGQETIDAYLEFLKAGNSASPAELLKIAGVDPLSDDAYEMAGELIDNLIDEFVEVANAAAASAG